MDEPVIIVIGASAGGFKVLQQLAADLPPDLPAALFIVWHISPESHGVLPQALERAGPLPAANATDGEAISAGRIYVAPPDHHLLVERGRVRITRGPKEHRFRPAVDPLFRSAAFAYGPRVVGVVLSGALDDGAAGLRAIKRRGGTAVAQDPLDAEVPSMPRSAIRVTAVDHILPASDLAALLVRLSREPIVIPEQSLNEDAATSIEIRIAAADNALAAGVMQLGTLTPYTCPDCHGALLTFLDGDLRRFRCHTGHAFSVDSLLAAVMATSENQLWSAVRSLEENLLLLNQLGDYFAEANQPTLAALYYRHASAADAQAQLIRQALDQHELLSADRLQQQADELQDGGKARDPNPS